MGECRALTDITANGLAAIVVKPAVRSEQSQHRGDDGVKPFFDLILAPPIVS